MHFTGSMISSRAKFFSMRSGLGRLRLVPLAVVFRRGMNVVRGFVVVLDLDVLPGHHAQHVRMILAALLVDGDRILGNVEGAVCPGRLSRRRRRWPDCRRWPRRFSAIVGALAGRVLAHVDLRRLGSRAVELHGAAHAGHGRGINRRRGWPPASLPSSAKCLALRWCFLSCCSLPAAPAGKAANIAAHSFLFMMSPFRQV